MSIWKGWKVKSKSNCILYTAWKIKFMTGMILANKRNSYYHNFKKSYILFHVCSFICKIFFVSKTEIFNLLRYTTYWSIGSVYSKKLIKLACLLEMCELHWTCGCAAFYYFKLTTLYSLDASHTFLLTLLWYFLLHYVSNLHVPDSFTAHTTAKDSTKIDAKLGIETFLTKSKLTSPYFKEHH